MSNKVTGANPSGLGQFRSTLLLVSDKGCYMCGPYRKCDTDCSKWVGYVGSKMLVLCCKKGIGHLSFFTFLWNL